MLNLRICCQKVKWVAEIVISTAVVSVKIRGKKGFRTGRKDQWWALVNTVMSLQVPYKVESFLSS
jgi:hypothetical protein